MNKEYCPIPSDPFWEAVFKVEALIDELGSKIKNIEDGVSGHSGGDLNELERNRDKLICLLKHAINPQNSELSLASFPDKEAYQRKPKLEPADEDEAVYSDLEIDGRAIYEKPFSKRRFWEALAGFYDRNCNSKIADGIDWEDVSDEDKKKIIQYLASLRREKLDELPLIFSEGDDSEEIWIKGLLSKGIALNDKGFEVPIFYKSLFVLPDDEVSITNFEKNGLKVVNEYRRECGRHPSTIQKQTYLVHLLKDSSSRVSRATWEEIKGIIKIADKPKILNKRVGFHEESFKRKQNAQINRDFLRLQTILKSLYTLFWQMKEGHEFSKDIASIDKEFSNCKPKDDPSKAYYLLRMLRLRCIELSNDERIKVKHAKEFQTLIRQVEAAIQESPFERYKRFKEDWDIFNKRLERYFNKALEKCSGNWLMKGEDKQIKEFLQSVGNEGSSDVRSPALEENPYRAFYENYKKQKHGRQLGILYSNYHHVVNKFQKELDYLYKKHLDFFEKEDWLAFFKQVEEDQFYENCSKKEDQIIMEKKWGKEAKALDKIWEDFSNKKVWEGNYLSAWPAHRLKSLKEELSEFINDKSLLAYDKMQRMQARLVAACSEMKLEFGEETHINFYVKELKSFQRAIEKLIPATAFGELTSLKGRIEKESIPYLLKICKSSLKSAHFFKFFNRKEIRVLEGVEGKLKALQEEEDIVEKTQALYDIILEAKRQISSGNPANELVSFVSAASKYLNQLEKQYPFLLKNRASLGKALWENYCGNKLVTEEARESIFLKSEERQADYLLKQEFHQLGNVIVNNGLLLSKNGSDPNSIEDATQVALSRLNIRENFIDKISEGGSFLKPSVLIEKIEEEKTRVSDGGNFHTYLPGEEINDEAFEKLEEKKKLYLEILTSQKQKIQKAIQEDKTFESQLNALEYDYSILLRIFFDECSKQTTKAENQRKFKKSFKGILFDSNLTIPRKIVDLEFLLKIAKDKKRGLFLSSHDRLVEELARTIKQFKEAHSCFFDNLSVSDLIFEKNSISFPSNEDELKVFIAQQEEKKCQHTLEKFLINIKGFLEEKSIEVRSPDKLYVTVPEGVAELNIINNLWKKIEENFGEEKWEQISTILPEAKADIKDDFKNACKHAKQLGQRGECVEYVGRQLDTLYKKLSESPFLKYIRLKEEMHASSFRGGEENWIKLLEKIENPLKKKYPEFFKEGKVTLLYQAVSDYYKERAALDSSSDSNITPEGSSTIPLISEETAIALPGSSLWDEYGTSPFLPSLVSEVDVNSSSNDAFSEVLVNDVELQLENFEAECEEIFKEIKIKTNEHMEYPPLFFSKKEKESALCIEGHLSKLESVTRRIHKFNYLYISLVNELKKQFGGEPPIKHMFNTDHQKFLFECLSLMNALLRKYQVLFSEDKLFVLKKVLEFDWSRDYKENFYKRPNFERYENHSQTPRLKESFNGYVAQNAQSLEKSFNEKQGIFTQLEEKKPTSWENFWGSLFSPKDNKSSSNNDGYVSDAAWDHSSGGF